MTLAGLKTNQRRFFDASRARIRVGAEIYD
jgi:hypothetical protein